MFMSAVAARLSTLLMNTYSLPYSVRKINNNSTAGVSTARMAQLQLKMRHSHRVERRESFIHLRQ